MPKKDMLNEVLNSPIVGWLKSTVSDEKDSAVGKWIKRALIGIVTTIALTFLYFKLKKEGEKEAKLKHQREKSLEKEHALNLKLDIEEDQKKIETLENTLKNLDNKITELELSISETHDNMEKIKVKIGAIENYEDLDNYIKSINNTNDSSRSRPN